MEIKRIPPHIFSTALTLACYRDTDIVENAHAGKSIVCDEDFFNEVYANFDTQLNEWVTRIQNEFEYQRENPGSVNDRLAAFTFVVAVHTLSYWDKPTLVKEKYTGNPTAYVLGGKFREACCNHWVFDDNAMGIINRDINNRLYTLARLKKFEQKAMQKMQ